MEIDQGHAIIVRRGDITTAATDAIVNAANEWLTPGGGVSGAIHRAGGPAIAEECRAFVAEHGALAVGSAAITTGGALPSRYVIHAVGPVWHHGRHNEAELLGAAYRSAIDIADEYGLVSVAFPSISTGVFGYPVELAAPVALEAIIDALSHAVHVREVEIVLFDETSYATWADVASDVLERP
jgi:O-acetyl-ADP-ribose deacetylase (regulator of RNase III)